jgi:hypothetical protein
MVMAHRPHNRSFRADAVSYVQGQRKRTLVILVLLDVPFDVFRHGP